MLSIIAPMICYKNTLGGRQGARAGGRQALPFRLLTDSKALTPITARPLCPRAFPRKILHFPFYCLLLSFVSRRKPFGDNVPVGATRWVLSSVETL